MFCVTRKRNDASTESGIGLKPLQNLSHLFNGFNSFPSDINNNPGNSVNAKYYDINHLQILNLFTDKSFSRLNTCFLSLTHTHIRWS